MPALDDSGQNPRGYSWAIALPSFREPRRRMSRGR
jgi:hypothetical protein